MSGVARPLPGSGVVVRDGDLMLVCAEGGEAVDELLAVIADVSRTGGDGAVLARRVAALLAADTSARFPACALSGPAGDQVAVLVYGRAMAELGTGTGSVTLSGVGAITSVDQLVPGPVERIQLYLPHAGEPDSRSRLDRGIVSGAGVVFLASSTMDPLPPRPVVPAQIASAATWTRPTPPRGIASPVFTFPGAAPRPVSPALPPVTAPPPPVALPVTMLPPSADLVPPPAAPDASPDAAVGYGAEVRPDAGVGYGAEVRPDAAVGYGAEVRSDAAVGYGAEVRPDAAVSYGAEVRPDAAVSHGAEVRPDAGVGYGAEVRADAADQAADAGPDASVDSAQPPVNSAVWPLAQRAADAATYVADDRAPDANGPGDSWPGPTDTRPVDDHAGSVADAGPGPEDGPDGSAGAPADGAGAEAGEQPSVIERSHVIGVFCPKGHFIDPRHPYCPVCGISLAQQTVVAREGVRPVLGSLLLDDGESVPLEIDYIIGRDPRNDPDAVAGLARPLKIVDAEGVVSRRHARISLVGWDVQIIDLGSSNGTFIQPPGAAERQQMAPHVPVVIRPGTVVTMGRRWLRFEPPRSA